MCAPTGTPGSGSAPTREALLLTTGCSFEERPQQAASSGPRWCESDGSPHAGVRGRGVSRPRKRMNASFFGPSCWSCGDPATDRRDRDIRAPHCSRGRRRRTEGCCPAGPRADAGGHRRQLVPERVEWHARRGGPRTHVAAGDPKANFRSSTCRTAGPPREVPRWATGPGVKYRLSRRGSPGRDRARWKGGARSADQPRRRRTPISAAVSLNGRPSSRAQADSRADGRSTFSPNSSWSRLRRTPTPSSSGATAGSPTPTAIPPDHPPQQRNHRSRLHPTGSENNPWTRGREGPRRLG